MNWKDVFSHRSKKAPDRFQRLTEEDLATYGEPEVVTLAPPDTDDPRCQEKAANWVAWRAASFAATRHSEYLDVAGSTEKILISAILRLPATTEDYLSSFSHKKRYILRGVKAEKAGYTCHPIIPAHHAEGIWRIIQSTTTRQGRPVTQTLFERSQNHTFSEYEPYASPLYQDICMGAFSQDGELVAYILGKRVGDHVQYDEIMAHAGHWQFNVLRLLHLEFLTECMNLVHPPRLLHYGSWYSGANPFSSSGGLNRWKRKAGFLPAYLMLQSL